MIIITILIIFSPLWSSQFSESSKSFSSFSLFFYFSEIKEDVEDCQASGFTFWSWHIWEWSSSRILLPSHLLWCTRTWLLTSSFLEGFSPWTLKGSSCLDWILLSLNPPWMDSCVIYRTGLRNPFLTSERSWFGKSTRRHYAKGLSLLQSFSATAAAAAAVLTSSFSPRTW